MLQSEGFKLVKPERMFYIWLTQEEPLIQQDPLLVVESQPVLQTQNKFEMSLFNFLFLSELGTCPHNFYPHRTYTT